MEATSRGPEPELSWQKQDIKRDLEILPGALFWDGAFQAALDLDLKAQGQ